MDDDLWLILPQEWSDRYGVKEGDEFDAAPLIAQLEKTVAAGGTQKICNE